MYTYVYYYFSLRNLISSTIVCIGKFVEMIRRYFYGIIIYIRILIIYTRVFVPFTLLS